MNLCRLHPMAEYPRRVDVVQQYHLSDHEGGLVNRTFLFASALSIGFCVGPQASAQFQPDSSPQAQMQQLCGNIATALTVGDQRAAYAFAPEARQMVGAQTGGTGRYPQLAALGQPVGAYVSQGQPVPLGVVFSCQVQHHAGVSVWHFAIVRGLVHRFQFQASGGRQPHPAPSTTAPAAPQPSPDAQEPGTPSRTEACARFPEMC